MLWLDELLSRRSCVTVLPAHHYLGCAMMMMILAGQMAWSDADLAIEGRGNADQPRWSLVRLGVRSGRVRRAIYSSPAASGGDGVWGRL